jgi:hypothetical protein
MGNLRCAEVQTRPLAFLDLTSLTVKEFREVVPPLAAAFQAPRTHGRLDGKPRLARRYPTSATCPLPPPEDRLWLILVERKTYPLQVVQGRRFGRGQSKAHRWIHVLLVRLRATWRTLGAAPTRSGTAWAQRLGVAEAEAAAMVAPPEESAPLVDPSTVPVPAPASPLAATMGPSGASSAPRLRLRKRAVIAARNRATPSNTCC